MFVNARVFCDQGVKIRGGMGYDHSALAKASLPVRRVSDICENTKDECGECT